MLTAPFYWGLIKRELAFWELIAGIEGFTKAISPFQQMAFSTFRASEQHLLLSGFNWINRFDMMALRVSTATDKHAITPLTQHQFLTTLWTGDAKFFNDMAIIVMQRFDVITRGIVATAKERTMFAVL
ncbi:hypothetical protein BOO29_13810 [Vibrio navarrensis]|nr:hypothetical protein EA25_06025 [Vibrio navarrensis]MBE3665627.1 hypothetical protein [Vibrio navarrensis]MBE4574950.1 hypothetical protein [Vibrio navarrensis]MBE4582336.1 hypothetical protein [Vibrio navarrensis]MBE4586009.1 hypothetical protein [Vibrio navarrensis]